MSWTTAIDDLRTLLSDGPTDKHRYRKKVFGRQDGINLTFKTFEFRRITNFVSGSTGGLGVFKNGVLQSATLDTPQVGEFTLTSAPANTDLLEASYYTQWFLDSELTSFLADASSWVGVTDSDYTSVSNGLRPCVLDYAASRAYQKLSLRYAENISEMYRVEDAMDPKRMEIVNSYRQASLDALKSAESKRKSFYSRQDQFEAPLFATSVGRVKDVPPRR